MQPIINSIVLADDDLDDIELFKDAVKQACPDLKLTTARDGKNLLDMLDLMAVPDVIVLDLNMPRIDGKGCLKAIRGSRKFDDVLVVMLSTSSNRHDMNTCLQNGADYYYVKPDNYNHLVNLVYDLCYGNMSRQPAVFG
jgi:CheY-like chemotaxis protein